MLMLMLVCILLKCFDLAVGVIKAESVRGILVVWWMKKAFVVS